MSEKATADAPELPSGFSVFEPQGSDKVVLRVPLGHVGTKTFDMEPERAHDLGRLLLARTTEWADDGAYCRNCSTDLCDPRQSGFQFDGDWFCSSFCAEVCVGHHSRGAGSTEAEQ